MGGGGVSGSDWERNFWLSWVMSKEKRWWKKRPKGEAFCGDEIWMVFFFFYDEDKDKVVWVESGAGGRKSNER
jgi:hypothetical protein